MSDPRRRLCDQSRDAAVQWMPLAEARARRARRAKKTCPGMLWLIIKMCSLDLF